MSYELIIEKKSNYLHAIVTGPNCFENVRQYMEEIFLKSADEKCFRVLIEERLEGPRLKTTDIFKIVSEGSQQVFGMFEAIAYVDVNAEEDLMQFAETVAVNRACL